MTSEDVTMFRKQLILIYFERDIYFCAALRFFVSIFPISSFSLSETQQLFICCKEEFLTSSSYASSDLFVVCFCVLIVCLFGSGEKT